MINIREFYIGLLLVFIFMVIGCAVDKPSLVTPETTLTISPTETKKVVVDPPIKPSIELTPANSPKPTPTRTPLATSTPTLISTAPPLMVASSLESVSDSHPVWAPLVQAVDKLQGFYILALSSDGKLFAAVDSHDDYSQVYMWEVETNNLKWVVDFDQSLSHSGLLFSPDGKMLAISTSTIEQDVFVLDVASGNELHHFVYQDHPADMKFSLDSKMLVVSGFIPGATTVWNLEDENRTEIGRSESIDFMPNGKDLILAVAKGQKSPNDPSPVYLYNLQSDERNYLFIGDYYSGRIAVSPDGKYLAANVTDELGWGNVRLIELQDDIEIQLEDAEPDEFVATFQISFSTKSHLVVLQRDLKIWDNNGQLLAVLDGENIVGFIITPDEKFLMTYGFYQTPMEVWEFP